MNKADMVTVAYRFRDVATACNGTDVREISNAIAEAMAPPAPSHFKSNDPNLGSFPAQSVIKDAMSHVYWLNAMMKLKGQGTNLQVPPYGNVAQAISHFAVIALNGFIHEADRPGSTARHVVTAHRPPTVHSRGPVRSRGPVQRYAPPPPPPPVQGRYAPPPPPPVQMRYAPPPPPPPPPVQTNYYAPPAQRVTPVQPVYAAYAPQLPTFTAKPPPPPQNAISDTAWAIAKAALDVTQPQIAAQANSQLKHIRYDAASGNPSARELLAQCRAALSQTGGADDSF